MSRLNCLAAAILVVACGPDPPPAPSPDAARPIERINLDASRPAPPPDAAGPSGGARSCQGNTTFKVGRGMYDITGPAAEAGMLGYGGILFGSTGIHTRLRARAFVVESPCNGNRVVMVQTDLWAITQAVKIAVVKRLAAKYGSATYNHGNVMLNATHNHHGPGGYSHYVLFNVFQGGLIGSNFETIVNGIFRAVSIAHDGRHTANISTAQGDLAWVTFNRSIPAYDNNAEVKDANNTKYYLDPASPAGKGGYHPSRQPHAMTLLRFDKASGGELGMINWFGAHGTVLGGKNSLISSGHKGHAAYLFQKLKKTKIDSKDTFVAAFAQGALGDVSPNIFGFPTNSFHVDAERVYKLGKTSYDKAVSLYNAAPGKPVTGGVQHHHRFVDFKDVQVAAHWTAGAGVQRTCRAALGWSFLAGAQHDGPLGAIVGPDRAEGASWSRDAFPALLWASMTGSWRTGIAACHGNKNVIFATDSMDPNDIPLTPEVLPIQVFTIGEVAIIALPFEVTTMGSRRIEAQVLDVLAGSGVTSVVVSSTSNAYAGYLTTKEEYDTQQYEGASVHFGPYTLAAVRQTLDGLLRDLRDGTRTPRPAPSPRDLTGRVAQLQTSVVVDRPPVGKSFGQAVSQPAENATAGDTVSFTVWGGHPKNDLKIQRSYLDVQHWAKSAKKWQSIAWDWSPETLYEWKRVDGAWGTSHVTIRWTIPKGTAVGGYRLRHFGQRKDPGGKIHAYSGTSRTIQVRPTYRPFVSGGKCLDVKGAKTANGTNVQLKTCNKKHDRQKWSVDADGLVHSKLKYSKCLDIDGPMVVGANIHLWDCSVTIDRQFRVDGALLRNKSDPTKVLEAAGGGTADGTNVQLGGHTGAPGQQFADNFGPNATLGLADFAEIRGWGGKCVQVTSKNSGRKVQMWTCDGSAKQKWFVDPHGYLRSKLDSRTCIGVVGPNAVEGAAIQVSRCDGGANQRWRWHGKVIRSKMGAGMALDVAAFSKADGAKVQLWKDNGLQNQKWTIGASVKGTRCISNFAGPTRVLQNSASHLDFQGDGNFVHYIGTKAVWSSKTWNKGKHLCMLDDGDLVVYDRNLARVWSSKTWGQPKARLVMQGADCNVVMWHATVRPFATGGHCF